MKIGGWLLPTAAAEIGEAVDLDETEKQVLKALSMERAIPAEDLMLATGLALPKLLHTLLRLQLKKPSKSFPAAIFVVLQQRFGYKWEI